MTSAKKLLTKRTGLALISTQSKRESKSLADIPGPQTLPIVGTSWKYFPIIGEYDISRLDEVGRKKMQRYGEIVLERVAGIEAVSVFNPADIHAVYQAEGKHPKRRSHLALLKYRTDRPHLYNSGGLFPSNGEEWWRLRQAFQQPVSPLQETRQFLPVADRITKDFLSKHIDPGKNIPDFLSLVSNLNLHLTWAALFGERSVSSISESMAERLVQAAEACNESVLTTDNTHFIWKYIKTPTYCHFERSMQYIEKLALDSIEEFTSSGESSQHDSIIAKFLSLSGVDHKDLLGMVIDLLLGGVDTTSYTSCLLLYRLCGESVCQEKLHNEAISLLPDNKDQMTPQLIKKASYTRAVLKETFRLNPISVGTSRFLQQDVTLPSGYLLPKGTLVMTQNLVACRREVNFPKALKFIPERWLQNEDSFQGRPHPYLLLPFGHGPRACIARRRAEQNLLLFIIRVFRNYRVEWKGKGELDIVTPLINKPDRPVSFLFTSQK